MSTGMSSARKGWTRNRTMEMEGCDSDEEPATEKGDITMRTSNGEQGGMMLRPACDTKTRGVRKQDRGGRRRETESVLCDSIRVSCDFG